MKLRYYESWRDTREKGEKSEEGERTRWRRGDSTGGRRLGTARGERKGACCTVWARCGRGVITRVGRATQRLTDSLEGRGATDAAGGRGGNVGFRAGWVAARRTRGARGRGEIRLASRQQPTRLDLPRSRSRARSRPLEPSFSLSRSSMYRAAVLPSPSPPPPPSMCRRSDVGGAPGCIRGVRDIRWRLRAIHPSTPPRGQRGDFAMARLRAETRC